MRRPPRGDWQGFHRMRPAAEYDIRFGHGLLRAESAAWAPYAVVTSPTAYSAALPHLSRAPRAVLQPKAMDFGYLRRLTDELPDGLELIVGIGGGLALDASKYAALRLQLPLALVPTIVSTGAIIHSVFAEWEGRNLGDTKNWPWIDAEYVAVDFDVVLSAPDHLNIAGVGDVLCGYSTVCEWRHRTKMGLGEPFREEAAAAMNAHHARIVDELPRSLDADGALTAASVKLIMLAIRDRDTRSLTHPDAPAGDHAFIVAAELANDRSWAHGELAALGAVIIAWHADERPDTLIHRLEACGVRWRPQQMGMRRDELARALSACPGYMGDASRGRDMPSILRTKPIAGRRLDDLWRFLSQH